MNEPAKSGRVPGHLLILPLFRAQAARTPAAPAVVRADGTAVTYAELGALADRFAAGLRSAGVRPGDFVGVCLRRGPELVAAFLGVWLAGAAYVPLDPRHPAARLAAVLADTGDPVVLAERATADSLPGTVRTLTVEGIQGVQGAESAESAESAEGELHHEECSSRPTPTGPPMSCTPPAPPAAPRACSCRTAGSPTGCAGWRTGTGSARATACC